MVGGFQVTLVFCFGLKPKFCSFDLDLDQPEVQIPTVFFFKFQIEKNQICFSITDGFGGW